MKKNYEKGLQELLELLKTHPGLVREVVFDTISLRKLLRSKAARKLALGEDPTAFIIYLSKPDDGYPIAQCGGGTKYLCAKGTRLQLTA